METNNRIEIPYKDKVRVIRQDIAKSLSILDKMKMQKVVKSYLKNYNYAGENNLSKLEKQSIMLKTMNIGFLSDIKNHE